MKLHGEFCGCGKTLRPKLCALSWMFAVAIFCLNKIHHRNEAGRFQVRIGRLSFILVAGRKAFKSSNIPFNLAPLAPFGVAHFPRY